MKYIYVNLLPREKRVTDRWTVHAKESDAILGIIQWRTGWRCYCFEPAFPTAYEHECLRDIADFIEAETKKHKSIPEGSEH